MPVTAKALPGSRLLSPKDHTLILIDFQSQMSFATKSIDAVNLRNNAALVSQAAAAFGVSAILTTVAEKTFSGPMYEEITQLQQNWSLAVRYEPFSQPWRACPQVDC